LNLTLTDWTDWATRFETGVENLTSFSASYTTDKTMIMTRDVSLDPSTPVTSSTRPSKGKSGVRPATTPLVPLFDIGSIATTTNSNSPTARRSFSSSTCSPSPSTHFATPEWASPGHSFKTYLDQLTDSLSGDEDTSAVNTTATLRTIASSVASMASRKRGSTPRSSSLPSSDLVESGSSVKKPKHNSKRYYSADSRSMTLVEKKVVRIADPPISAASPQPGPPENEYISFPSLKDDVEDDNSLNGKEVL
jgi:hypothetical protein